MYAMTYMQWVAVYDEEWNWLENSRIPMRKVDNISKAEGEKVLQC